MPRGLGTQIIAGILGLLFVVGLVFVGRKIGEDLKKRFASQRQDRQVQAQVTPTSPPLSELVGISPSPIPAEGEIIAAVSPQDRVTKGGVKEIPRTGAESLLLITFLIPAGIYLRKKS